MIIAIINYFIFFLLFFWFKTKPQADSLPARPLTSSASGTVCKWTDIKVEFYQHQSRCGEVSALTHCQFPDVNSWMAKVGTQN